MPRHINKEQILNYYKSQGEIGAAQRELAFLDMQKINRIPTSVKYSDENYFEYIGKDVAEMASTQALNDYLINIDNTLSLIDYIRIVGDDDSWFNRGLQAFVPYGDTARLMYTNPAPVVGYDINEFVPTKTSGGDKIKQQLIQLDNNPDKTKNKDRNRIGVDVPTLLINQALQGAIQTGLANGWLTIFDEQMGRGWSVWKFNRHQLLLSMAGGIPADSMWTKEEQTFTANDASFVEITEAVKDVDTFQNFITQMYSVSATLQGNYSDLYNPAKINQRTPIANQSVWMSKDYQALWKTTNAILFNSKEIDIKNIYRNVEFLSLLPSKVKKEAVNVKAILYAGNPVRHYPFTDGIERGIQMWVTNRTTSIYDHFWIASGWDLSKPVIVFYEKSEANTEKDKVKGK